MSRAQLRRAKNAIRQTEIETAKRRIAQIDKWLTRHDLSPACRQVALVQKAEYEEIIRDREAELAGVVRWLMPLDVALAAVSETASRHAIVRENASRVWGKRVVLS